MKKVLMLLSLIALSANVFAMKEKEKIVDLGEKKIYSETGFENSLRSTTSSPFVVDSKTIERKKYTSVSEILNDISGINELDMRGQGKSKKNETVQLLIDGVPSNFLDNSHQSAPIDLVNVEDIERIEVIPGGGAVLYGSGTSGGIINVITKNYKDTHGRVGYRYGSYGHQIGDIRAGTSVGPVDVTLSYRKDKSNGYRRDNNESDSDYFSGKAVYNINDKDYFSIQYNRYESEYKNPYSLTKEELEKDRRQSGVLKTTKSKNEDKKDEIRLTYNDKINDNYELNISGFYQKTEMMGDTYNDGTKSYTGMLRGQRARIARGLSNPSLSVAERARIQKKLDEIDNQLRNIRSTVYTRNSSLFGDKKLGIKLKNKFNYGAESNFVLGLGYLRNHMTRKSKYEYVDKLKLFDFDIELDKNTYEIFGINTYKYNKFEFIQGLRFEKAKYKGSRANLAKSNEKYKVKEDKKNLAGTLAVNYLYSDTGNVYLKYERGFTSPNPARLMDKVIDPNTKTPIYVLNNLKSEKTDSIELGWNEYLLNSLVSADIYFSQTKDEIKTIFKGGHADPNSTFKNVNIGKTRRYGFDLKAEQRLSKFTFKEAYSYVNAKIIKSSIKETEKKYISYIPAHKFVLGVDYAVNDKLSFGLDGQCTSDYYLLDNNKYGKDGKKVVFNFRANYEIIDGLNVYAGINNLFDNKYNRNVYINESRRGAFKTYDPAPTRNYYAGFSYKF